MRLIFSEVLFALTIGSSCLMAQPANTDRKAEQPEPKSPPKLKMHSKLHSSVFQGDSITLQAKVSGDNLIYRWVRNYRTICRKASCTFSTKKWGIGKQVVTAVIYNRLESRSINFFVKVLARPEGKKVADITPKLVKPKTVEKIKEGDFSVSALVGIGYSNVGRKINIISKLPAYLRWNEKLRSHVKGILQFGVKDSDEHLILPRSLVSLAETNTGRRVINLRKGIIRSRQLQEKQPNWSILNDKWLQVDGDEHADIIVHRKNKKGNKVAVYVLRGNARVYYSKNTDNKETSIPTGKSIILPAGSQTRFIKGREPSRLYAPNSQTLVDVFSRSTPQYIPVSEDEKRKKPCSFLTKDIRVKRSQNLASALETSEKLLSKRDYILALENLLPLIDKSKNNYEYSFLLAKTYRELGIYNPAIIFFRNAIRLEPKKFEPHYELGVLYIAARRWELAANELGQAMDLGHPPSQLIEYYLGVAHFNIEQKLTARNHFKKSLWEPVNSDIEVSSWQFLQLLKGQQTFGANLSMGFGQDSNVYRWGSDARTDSYKTESALYYQGSAETFYRFYGSNDGDVKIGYDAVNRRYIDGDLKDIETLRQRLHLDWTLLLGFNDQHIPAFSLYVEPFIELFGFGENERSADTLGYEIHLGFPQFPYSPKFKYYSGSVTDPVPGRDDKLDPIRHEPVIASDRSGSESRYAINVDLHDGLTTDIQSELTYNSFTHKESAVSIDDFTQFGLDLMTQTKISHTMKLLWDIGYRSRDFKNSSESRKDSTIDTEIALQYFYSPSLFNDLRIEYTSQNSSDSTFTYNRYDIGLFLTLEL